MAKKTILFGGSFDPIHRGHIIVAKSAAKQIGADEVVFIPTRRSPHKELFPSAGNKARLDMVSIAISEENTFQVSDCELKRPDPSYTIDTIRFFRQTFPDDTQFYWLIGADMLAELPKWHEMDHVVDECNLSVMNRGGIDVPDVTVLEGLIGSEAVEKLKKNMISTPMVEVSSTEIRAKIAAKQDVSELLDADVLSYIHKNRLYS
ncbi:MAG TPA: nicotinate (nicotinamide) nucleotide adenylyltransferase [Phycisphaerales bacterium]|nr:nicotinate (nicotinamide) nucleotide adenylyltransferase [Phycisphaerales bacterium]